MERILFYIIALVIVSSGILVISRRNPVNSAVFMLVAFFGVAALFALLGAHFIAAMQVLLYAGAILVLFVFVIMLLNLSPTLKRLKVLTARPFIFGSAALYLGAVVSLSLYFAEGAFVQGEPVEGTVEAVGRLLLTSYMIPFELTAVLLFVAIVGAVTLARREK